MSLLVVALSVNLAASAIQDVDIREAEARIAAGQFAEAHGFYRRALARCERDAEESLATCIGQRVAVQFTGTLDDALARDEPELRAELAAAAPESPEAAPLRLALLRNLARQGRAAELREAMALVLAEDGRGLKTSLYAEMLTVGALALADGGQPEAGLALLDRQTAARRPRLTEGMYRETRGRVLFLLGRDDEAIAAYRSALESYGDHPLALLRRMEVMSRLAEVYAETDFWSLTTVNAELWSLQLEFARGRREHPSDYVTMASYAYELPAYIRMMEAHGRWMPLGIRIRPPIPCGSGHLNVGQARVRAVDPDTMVRLNVMMAYNHYGNQDLEQARRCAVWGIHVVDQAPSLPAARKAPALLMLAVLENVIALEEDRITPETIARAIRLTRLTRSLVGERNVPAYYVALLSAFESFLAEARGDHARAYALTRDALLYTSDREIGSTARHLPPGPVRQSGSILDNLLRRAWAGAHTAPDGSLSAPGPRAPPAAR